MVAEGSKPQYKLFLAEHYTVISLITGSFTIIYLSLHSHLMVILRFLGWLIGPQGHILAVQTGIYCLGKTPLPNETWTWAQRFAVTFGYNFSAICFERNIRANKNVYISYISGKRIVHQNVKDNTRLKQ